jgi:hypothetical protein
MFIFMVIFATAFWVGLANLLARVSPILESLFVGVTLAAVGAMISLAESGQALTWPVVSVAVGGAIADYLTSFARQKRVEWFAYHLNVSPKIEIPKGAITDGSTNGNGDGPSAD